MSEIQSIDLNADAWRPAGWLGTDSRWTVAEVDTHHADHVKFGWVTKRGILVDDVVEDGKVVKQGCPEKRRTQVAEVAHDHALLRDCWATDPIVWKIVELFFGGPIDCDPFWNPWGGLTPKVRLDGSLGYDGFAVNDSGHAKYWRGRVGANGPHSATSQTPDVPEGSHETYAPGGWVRMCNEYGKTEQCAAVVPQRGDTWFHRYGAACDLILEFGRLDFNPPPGIHVGSNPGCTQVLLWTPDRRCSPHVRRLFEQGSYRFLRPRKNKKHKLTGLRASEVLVRPGIASYNPETDNILGIK